MKNLILLLCMIFALGANSQKIKECKIDKFTKQQIIQTSQEVLINRNKWKGSWDRVLISLKNVDGSWVMPAFIELKNIEKYDEGSNMVLLLDNEEIISLQSIYTGIGSEECHIGIGGVNSNVHGFSTVFRLTPEEIELLRLHKVTDVRITPLGSIYDFEVGKKEQDLIQRMINLIDDKNKK